MLVLQYLVVCVTHVMSVVCAVVSLRTSILSELKTEMRRQASADGGCEDGEKRRKARRRRFPGSPQVSLFTGSEHLLYNTLGFILGLINVYSTKDSFYAKAHDVMMHSPSYITGA